MDDEFDDSELQSLDSLTLVERRSELAELMGLIAAEVARDGGTAVLGDVDYETGVVNVVLGGACSSCSLTGGTLEDGVKRILMQRLDWVTRVEGVVDEDDSAMGMNGWRPRA